ncbi:hypothetical protein Tco_0694740 [Tanacetum coccineum]
MEAHCVNLELKYQNQALKEGQHGQFSKVKSNEAKVKHDIDVIETINIELEHKMAKLFKENGTLKRHYKELSDSIKTTRAKTIEHTTSLIAQNAEFKAQLQERGFAIAALKIKLRKLTGNSQDKLGIHDHNNEPSSSKLVPKVVPSADTTAPSKQELDLLFGPLYDEFFTAGTSCVNKSSSPTDNSSQQDTPPSATAQSTTELITPTTTIIAKDNM